MKKTKPETTEGGLTDFRMQITPRPREVSCVLEDILVELRAMRELDEQKYKEFLEYKSKKQDNNPNIRPYSSLFSEQNKQSGKEHEKEKT